MKMRNLAAVLVMLLTLGCQKPQEPLEESTAPTEPVTAATDTTTEATTATEITPTEKPMSEYVDKVAVLNTSMGKITIRFFPDVAPNHVRNFIDLSEQGFYTGTRFHRTIPGFVIQGGDPNTKTDNQASWGRGGSGRMVNAEFNPIHHRRGILSMARSSDPNSASSQFFIVVKDAGSLDNEYTVFGEVVDGMDVVDKIVSAPARGETPVNPVRIEGVTIRAATAKEKGPTPK